MANFHRWLDTLFHQRVTFSIFFRIWLAFVCVVLLASSLTLYQLQKSIRPAAQRVVEDTLVDTSRLLAVLFGAQFGTQISQNNLDNKAVNQALDNAFVDDNQWQTPIWFHHKTKSQFHIYLTDHMGKVIYDSRNIAVGRDFSRWNDVYLTLRGKYGVRSTRLDPNDEQSSVMYVASPITDSQGRLIGVVSVGKPVSTLLPYINASRDEMLKTMLSIATLGILISALMAWWLRHSINAVNQYTQQLGNTTPPHFYLAKELNELITTIDTMKHTIENKAYVTDYVHTLTHELKSPLTAIRASGELLGEDLSDVERAQFSQTVLQQSDKLQQLVERLLVIAKLEQPNVKLSRTPTPLYPLVAQCVNNQSAWQQQKQLTVMLMIDDNPSVNIDKFWFSQALQNLIDNGIKFAQHWLIIHAKSNENGTVINVINDCVMLPDYILTKAFERYFSVENHRADTSQPSASKGTGLGLTLVKRVIELHGGDIGMTQQALKDTSIDFDKTGYSFDKTMLEQHCICLSIDLPNG